MTDPTPQDRARSLIQRNSLMALATADAEGRAWVSPVFYSVDDDHDLYWVSGVDARHSANVRDTASVTLVIHDVVDGQTDAVYVEAEAVELTDEAAVRDGIEVMARREQAPKWQINGIADVTGKGPWRIYRAARQSTWVRNEFKRGCKTVVGRVPADF